MMKCMITLVQVIERRYLEIKNIKLPITFFNPLLEYILPTSIVSNSIKTSTPKRYGIYTCLLILFSPELKISWAIPICSHYNFIFVIMDASSSFNDANMDSNLFSDYWFNDLSR